jgi:hypothetical protein
MGASLVVASCAAQGKVPGQAINQSVAMKSSTLWKHVIPDPQRYPLMQVDSLLVFVYCTTDPTAENRTFKFKVTFNMFEKDGG